MKKAGKRRCQSDVCSRSTAAAAGRGAPDGCSFCAERDRPIFGLINLAEKIESFSSMF